MAELTSKKKFAGKSKRSRSCRELYQAADLYQKVIEEDNLAVQAYDRLMIVYRKLKDYKKELLLIDNAVKAYQDFYNTRVSQSKKVTELSNKLAKSFGLIDKKGNSTYDPEPIGRWKKRRLVVEKKQKPKKK